MFGHMIKSGEKLHTRDIQLATYLCTDSRIIVHGVLKDRRHAKVYDVTGTAREPGIVHHLDVKLLIQVDSLEIEEAQIEMVHVPLAECPATLDTVEKLKGLEVKAGFSKKIRGLMGGKKGCAHLCNLIIAMSQEIVQGALACKRQNRPSVPKDIDSLSDKGFLIDSCRMWTRDGPKVTALKKAIEAERRR